VYIGRPTDVTPNTVEHTVDQRRAFPVAARRPSRLPGRPCVDQFTSEWTDGWSRHAAVSSSTCCRQLLTSASLSPPSQKRRRRGAARLPYTNWTGRRRRRPREGSCHPCLSMQSDGRRRVGRSIAINRTRGNSSSSSSLECRQVGLDSGRPMPVAITNGRGRLPAQLTLAFFSASRFFPHKETFTLTE